MNRKGFTLVEFLICLVLLGIVLVLGLCASSDMLRTSLSSLRSVSDNEVFKAAKTYVQENNSVFNDDSYACVTVKELIDYGYLVDTNDYELRDKIVKVKKNKVTKVIYDIGYTNSCD